ncbi:acyltransferase [Bradyrhizobium sp. SZCCHNRI3042]|uniref:acyltransferase n=1 Tax=Bradyrhizobium sp. SZCCHNRI3042 TaxID=3057291 RepID=UPI0029160A31|nr:acyltransferase [Bradyrhizobium sp. SZCCHNRI3042]
MTRRVRAFAEGLLARLVRPRHLPSADRRIDRALADIDQTAVFYPTASLHTHGHPPEALRIGAHTHVRGELLLFGHGGRIRLGEYCYVGEQTRIWSAREISIGNRVLISHMCTIMDNLTHPLDASERHQQFRDIITAGHPRKIDLDEQPVIIEDDALISCHCVVLRGVRIGRGAVIGAGSVVTKDVPPMVIAAGNPAKVIRELDMEAVK